MTPTDSINLTILTNCFVVVLGLCIGSFVNVVIYRLPRKKSLIRPGSACPGCGQTIKWYLNIPVLSYLFLRGRCAGCGERISFRYPLVEMTTGILFLLFFRQYGLSVTTIGFWLLSAALVAVFFIDLDFKIIPDAITLPGIVVGLVFSLVSDHQTIVSSLLGILAGGGTFLAMGLLGQAIFKKESLGGGDIKLAAMLGAFLGPLRVFLIFISSAAIGLLVSIVILTISARFRRERLMPFGPFLVLAAILVVFYGAGFVDWYWNTFIPQ